MEIKPFKGGEILADKVGNAFLLLNHKYDVVSYVANIIIPYSEVEVIFRSPIEGHATNKTRLLANDFKVLDKVTWEEARKRNAAATVLYGQKA